MTDTLVYQPVRDGYQVSLAYPVVEVKLSAGPSRRRREHLFATHTVDLTWLLTSPDDYTAFNRFFRQTLDHGTEAFLVELLTDIGVTMPHMCRTMGNLPKLTQQKGLAYWMSATVEVETNPSYGVEAIFNTNTGDQIALPNLNGRLGPLQPGDIVRVMGSDSVEDTLPLNFDGIYTVDSFTAPSTITLDDAPSVSADWTVLNGTVAGSTTSTGITTVIKLPT
jgi:hypothetical protein